MKQDVKASDLKGLREGNIHAFNRVYQVYHSRLYHFSFKFTRSCEDAREIVQEVFVKLWENRELIDPDKNFSHYLFTMAKNKVYNRARKRVVECAYKQYVQHYHTSIANTTEEQFQSAETTALFEAALEKLTPKRKQIITLSRLDGKSNREIATLLDTSVSNVENQINKALKTLQRFMLSQESVNVLALFFFLFD